MLKEFMSRLALLAKTYWLLQGFSRNNHPATQ
jgi:hypothetical protein